MRVTVVGTGYVGLVSGTCFAEIGHDVFCVDINKDKVANLKNGIIPIYEPGLEELVERNAKKERLQFSNDFSSVSSSKVIFLAVGTPSTDQGSANLDFIREAAKSVAKNIEPGAVIVIKSTVPIGTSKEIEQLISTETKHPFHLVSNPEFLREGSAVDDFLKPDRVVIGCRDEEAVKVMRDLYKPLLSESQFLTMSNLSAEMTKYASNCFLATKISFINEIARLCDLAGADIDEVRKGMISDVRIGKHFLKPGAGYGGSCFPKDVKALLFSGKEHDYDLKIIGATEEVNELQKKYILTKLQKHFQGDLKGKKIGIWGLAFKPNTDDIREAPSLVVCSQLLDQGAQVVAYDPIAGANFTQFFNHEKSDSLTIVDDMYEAVEACDALILLTEWGEFQSPNYPKLAERLNQPVVFDARNIYDTKKLAQLGFTYYAIGKS